MHAVIRIKESTESKALNQVQSPAFFFFYIHSRTDGMKQLKKKKKTDAHCGDKLCQKNTAENVFKQTHSTPPTQEHLSGAKREMLLQLKQVQQLQDLQQLQQHF